MRFITLERARQNHQGMIVDLFFKFELQACQRIHTQS